MRIKKTDKKWGIIYSHYHGDMGMQTGLTYQEAEAKSAEMQTNKHLDFVHVAYFPDGNEK